MPRIRTVKPEFWSDTRMRQEALTRCVFLCLLSMADDEGRIEGDDSTVWRFGNFPEPSGAIRKALDDLVDMGRVVKYEADGNPYLQVRHFRRHQQISHPTKSKLPAPPNGCADSGDFRKLPEDSGKLRPDQVSGNREQGTGKKRKARPKKPAAAAPLTALPDWLPAEAWDSYVAHRKQLRKPLTESSALKVVVLLDQLRAAGDDPAKVIEQSVVQGWTGLFALKGRKPKQAGIDAGNAGAADTFVRGGNATR